MKIIVFDVSNHKKNNSHVVTMRCDIPERLTTEAHLSRDVMSFWMVGQIFLCSLSRFQLAYKKFSMGKFSYVCVIQVYASYL